MKFNTLTKADYKRIRRKKLAWGMVRLSLYIVAAIQIVTWVVNWIN